MPCDRRHRISWKNIVYELLKDGWDVRAFGLPGSNSIYIKELSTELMYGDVTKFKDVEKAVNGCDSVIHVAGDTSWWKKRFELQREINVTGAVNVAKACLKLGVKRLIHTSTTDTLGYNSSLMIPYIIASKTMPQT